MEPNLPQRYPQRQVARMERKRNPGELHRLAVSPEMPLIFRTPEYGDHAPGEVSDAKAQNI